jgi:hypothetical protein
MFGSDRSRPEDYRRAVVIDTGSRNTTKEETLWSKRRGTPKTPLTEPTLLEMSQAVHRVQPGDMGKTFGPFGVFWVCTQFSCPIRNTLVSSALRSFRNPVR